LADVIDHAVRAGFYAENILLYAAHTQRTQRLSIPLGSTQKFAPVALGDISQIAAHVLTSEGHQGLGDLVRGQLIIMTGPMWVSFSNIYFMFVNLGPLLG
jgi:hypothetical protein